MADKYVMPKEKLGELLQATGWLPKEGNITVDQIRKATKQYQKFHGLKEDGWAGHLTERHLELPRICPHGDRLLEIGSGLNRWSLPIAETLTWGIKAKPSQFSLEDFKAMVQDAFDSWKKVCKIKVVYKPNAKTSDVQFLMGVSNIDGAGGTLGWSYLPQGTDFQGQIEQLYDATERWTYSETPAAHEIDIGRVLRHEIGHGIGLPHLKTGNLLQPMYDVRISRPQIGDIDEVVKRYGLSTGGVIPNPPPPPPPVDPSVRQVTIRGTFEIIE